jgi:hypothetical protein
MNNRCLKQTDHMKSMQCKRCNIGNMNHEQGKLESGSNIPHGCTYFLKKIHHPPIRILHDLDHSNEGGFGSN